MANLGNDDLRTALAEGDGALQNDLTRFSSAKSWQGFLGLSDTALDEQSLDPAVIQKTLERFERVANNPAYQQISSLDSFAQTRGLLAELANRSEGPRLGSPSSDPAVQSPADEQPAADASPEKSVQSPESSTGPEQLPAPQSPPATTESAKPAPAAAQPARANTGERSILVRNQ